MYTTQIGFGDFTVVFETCFSVSSHDRKKKKKGHQKKHHVSAVSTLAVHSIGAICSFLTKRREECLKSMSDDKDDREPMMRYIDENIIGNDVIYDGPFGPRKGITVVDHYSKHARDQRIYPKFFISDVGFKRFFAHIL